MNEIVNNKVNLCDSCSQVYPDCTSKPEDVCFGDGIGHDNICACSEYQPEKRTEERMETHECDLISRQAAVDALGDFVENWTDSDYELGQLNQWKADRKAIIALPSAQPEVIHCGDCKYKDDGIDEDGIPFLKCLNGRSYGGTRINDYCSWAERRQDE